MLSHRQFLQWSCHSTCECDNLNLAKSYLTKYEQFNGQNAYHSFRDAVASATQIWKNAEYHRYAHETILAFQL
jgi:hypothetical protein